MSGRGVDLDNPGKLRRRKPVGNPDDSRPQPLMHQCDLPIDEPTHENGVGLPHRSGDLEDVRPCGCPHQLPRIASPTTAVTSDGTGPEADSSTTAWVRTYARACPRHCGLDLDNPGKLRSEESQGPWQLGLDSRPQPLITPSGVTFGEDEPTHTANPLVRRTPVTATGDEDVSTLWVSPPTSSNRFADDGRDE